jgi:D-arabinose 5-phosphate isomerase GutQ
MHRNNLMDTIELSKKMLHTEADVLHKLADQIGETFIQGAVMLASCKGHIITSGVGTTGMVARRFAHLLCNVGCPALFLHSGDSLHGSSGAVKGEDMLFLLSKTGETKETCDMARIVAERGSPIITLTASGASTLARLSSLVLLMDLPAEIDPYGGLMSVGSTLAMAAYFDALVYAALELKGTPREWFVQGHPGGIISKLKDEH